MACLEKGIAGDGNELCQSAPDIDRTRRFGLGRDRLDIQAESVQRLGESVVDFSPYSIALLGSSKPLFLRSRNQFQVLACPRPFGLHCFSTFGALRTDDEVCQEYQDVHNEHPGNEPAIITVSDHQTGRHEDGY